MKTAAFAILCSLLLLFLSPSSSEEELGDVFLVLMREEDASSHASTFTLEDNYCLDPVLPREQSSCRIRVLAPEGSYYSESRIKSMSLDFQHPSRPRTACHVRWDKKGNVRTWCVPRGGRPGGGDGWRRWTGGRWWRRLPPFRNETATTGEIIARHLLYTESRCNNTVGSISYYRDGLDGSPERRPTVVFRTRPAPCEAGIAFGRSNNLRTTEAPCVYNQRRRCRPLTRAQYDILVRAVEGSNIFVDFRTTSDRPQ